MIAIENGRIVLKDRILEGKVLLVEEDRIHSFADEVPKNAEKVINAHERYIVPGFIDVHSDKIEQFIQPRPTARLDFELALKECERELLHLGITTIYHSFSLYKDEKFGKSPLRTKESVREMAALVRNIHTRNHLIHHRFHLRIEIDNLEAYDIARSMIEENMADEISFMDHTPGQGQYKDLAIYCTVLARYHERPDMSREEMEAIAEKEKNKERLTFEQMKELCSLAHAHGIAVASHDDDTPEKLDINKKINVDISEFPINLETAEYAKKLGLATVVGAPNILLGGSHSGNMSAAEAILNDCADILCSDYYPSAMLHGVFTMNSKYGVGLPEMIQKVSLNPAKALGIDKDYGSIEPGKKADLLVVEILDGYPVITHVMVDGRTTSRVEYRR
ncbi:MAG: alpha-D-ribose 1-methylphosphonate 5-triphosphate diphosphatase [Lachnospiraceae bacterium]|nr:alpha-D-ribose 1-methylphosphonate 5-triphosphate diphosphatase [Lachnospiraceae bacterium]